MPASALSRTAPAAPRLVPWVRGYVQQGIDVPPPMRLRLAQSASAESVICVTWSGQVWIEDFGPDPIPLFAFAPVFARSIVNTYAGQPRGFFVRLAPTAPLTLFGLTAADFRGFDPFAEGRGRHGAAMCQWADAVAAADGFEARVRLTDALFQGFRPERTPRVDLLHAATEAIEAAHGVLRVSDLAARLGVGESTLRRHFCEGLGISAKRIADVVRFRAAHAFLHRTPEATWADAVERFGYADQAHFIRAYHRFSGVSPTQWDDAWRFIDLNFGIEAEAAVAGERFIQDA